MGVMNFLGVYMVSFVIINLFAFVSDDVDIFEHGAFSGLFAIVMSPLILTGIVFLLVVGFKLMFS